VLPKKRPSIGYLFAFLAQERNPPDPQVSLVERVLAIPRLDLLAQFHPGPACAGVVEELDHFVVFHTACIRNHKAGILHRDVSLNNVLVSEEKYSTWPGFLIDLDLAIRENRLQASGALQKTGTKVFMAIGALKGPQHSFMHDLESFFWVLFWICMHYNGPNEPPTVVKEFKNWNYMSTTELAKVKSGTIFDEASFMETVVPNITPYFEPLTRYLEKLRTVVFPNDKLWKVEDKGLYERVREVLRKAMMDPEVRTG